MSDGFLNVLMDSIIGRYYHEGSEHSYAIFYSVQSLASGVAFITYILVRNLLSGEKDFRLFEVMMNITSLTVGYIFLVVLNGRRRLSADD